MVKDHSVVVACLRFLEGYEPIHSIGHHGGGSFGSPESREKIQSVVERADAVLIVIIQMEEMALGIDDMFLVLPVRDSRAGQYFI